MGLVSKFHNFLKSSLLVFVAFCLALSTLAPLSKAFADAPDPVLPDTQGQYTVKNDGSITLTVNGTWAWTTHNSDCNTDRYAAGWAVDWNDPNDPGNLVGDLKGLHAYVGTQTDNTVHYYSTSPRCGIYGSHLVGYDKHGNPIYDSYNTGDWGPISHTYPAGTTTIDACVVTYDVHAKNNDPGQGVKNADELIAGGDNHNTDNSVEKNGDTPLGNGCWSANFQDLIVVKHVVNTGGGTASASDFTMNVTAGHPSVNNFPGSESGTTVQIDTGSYNVSEGDHTGYVETLSDGCTGTIAAGETKICTVTNTYVGTIDICHATDSNSNPYEVNHPSKDGDVDGHDNHNGPIWYPDIPKHTAWGDIIPPFDYTDANGQTQHYPGKNWTTTGQAIYDNGCSVQGTLTVNKTLLPASDTGTFDLLIDGKAKASGVGDGGTTGAVTLDPGNHVVSETGHGTTDLSKYSSSFSGACDANGDVSLGVAENLTCTITNSRYPTLTLEKTVDNNYGGTKTASDFQGKIDSNNVSWDSLQTLSIGSHTASETNLPGYSASDWGGNCAADGSITLSAGQNATCTITNSDIAPTLTLVKKVTNDNGGTANANAWTLKAQHGGDTALINEKGTDSNGTTEATTSTVDATAGVSYDLSESGGPSGYLGGNWSCDGGTMDGNSVTLALAEDVTCTITNDDIVPTLTLYKYVVNDNSGTKTATDFQGQIDGQNVNWQTSVPLSAGSHTASEINLPGYTASDWSGDCNTDGTVTLELGQEYSCWIVNDDNPNPAIHVVKKGPSSAAAGSTVTYSFTVTNIGDTPLDNVTVSDNIAGAGVYQSGDTNNDQILETDETWIYTANYTIPISQFKSITNTVTACGYSTRPLDEEVSVDAFGKQVCDQDQHTLVIPKVLAAVTPPKVLANTGQNSAAAILLGIALLGMLGATTYISKKSQKLK